MDLMTEDDMNGGAVFDSKSLNKVIYLTVPTCFSLREKRRDSKVIRALTCPEQARNIHL